MFKSGAVATFGIDSVLELLRAVIAVDNSDPAKVDPGRHAVSPEVGKPTVGDGFFEGVGECDLFKNSLFFAMEGPIVHAVRSCGYANREALSLIGPDSAHDVLVAVGGGMVSFVDDEASRLPTT